MECRSVPAFLELRVDHMAVLKSYTCSKCGGVLKFDSDQDFFDCPFCGYRFDAADFHEEEMLVRAEESLREKAFMNARQKFNAVLRKDPVNFEALRGLVFCAAGISSLDEIETPEDFGKCKIDEARKVLDFAISAAAANDKEFFRAFVDLISSYRACNTRFIEYSAPAPRTMNDLREQIAKLDERKKRVENYRTDYSRKLAKLRRFEQSAREANAKKNIQENSLSECPKADYSVEKVNPSETIACAKCGALLNLDTEKRVYRCDSCGVAYGISLFFGHHWEKALDAMNSGRFEEAKMRFSNALLVNPSDFEAYMGVILCEGKWSKVSDIDDSDEVEVDTSRRIFALIRKAKMQMSESDQAYLDELWKMISTLKKLSENTKQLKSFKDKLRVNESSFIRSQQAAKTNTKYDDAIEEFFGEIADALFAPKDNHETINKKLNGEIEVCKKEIEQLSSEFAAIRESVLAMRSDSVFCK